MNGDKRKTSAWHLWAGCLLALFAVAGGAAQVSAPVASSEQGVQAALQRAIEEIRDQPAGYEQYDYIMTARVRLLLFWAGADDVGGGYIRRGISPDRSSAAMIQLVIGSDPAKAPRSINRWGAAWELAPRSADEGQAEPSMFFGFMKVSSGTSLSAMQKELAQEKQQGSKFLFSATIAEASPNGSVSKVVPFPSDRDFTIHQLDQATPAVFDRLAEPGGQLRSVNADEIRACGRSEGFLSSVSELIDGSLEDHPLPVSLCYIFNGERFRLKLTEITRVPQETVQLSLHQEPRRYMRTYHDLLLERFENVNEDTKKSSNFELLLGTKGSLRGVPLRISYQPNWWFQVVLNMRTPETRESASNP